MYKAPIEIVEDMQNKFSKQFDEWIVRAVISCGFNVDKERLFHALEYDKYAYESGYSDGKLDAMQELVRCKDCKWKPRNMECNVDVEKLDFPLDNESCVICPYGSDDPWYNREPDPNGFCSKGERKE